MTSLITFTVGVSVRGPIVPGKYSVGKFTVNVAYLDRVNLGFPTPIQLPKGASTIFTVEWTDENDKASDALNSKTFERNIVIDTALEPINQLLSAFKFVRVGHADGLGIRTIGRGDTLFYFAAVNGQSVGNLNLGIKLDKLHYPWRAVAEGENIFDPGGTTKLALPYINSEEFAVARRFVRCFELVEHGYFAEALIVSVSILDDVVQSVVSDRMSKAGLTDIDERQEIMRGIKEARLKIYLGPLLKLTAGFSMQDLWPDSAAALKWVNRRRNDIAHNGSKADQAAAARTIFVSTKIVAALNKKGLTDAKLPYHMLRQARAAAASTLDRPAWVPNPGSIEIDEFDPDQP